MHRHFNYFIAGSIALSMVACGDDTSGPQVTPLEITTSTLQAGSEGEDYQVEVTASGGTGLDFRWSVADGGLPTGVFLRSEGTPTTLIAGRPRSGGSSTFTLRVRDSEGNEGTRAFTIDIAAAPAAVEITTTMLPDALVTQAYSAEITAQNGDSYSWRLLSGQLPEGLSLAEMGTPSTTLAGMPTLESVGRYSFTIQVQDGSGNRSEAQYSIEVIDDRRPLEALPQSLPSGNVGLPYSADLIGRFGSMTDYAWSIVSGELPPGVTLAGEGTPNVTISGTPTLRGSYAFRVQVTDSEGNTARQSYFIEVDPAPPPLNITTFQIADGRVGTAYSEQISAVQGSGMGYTWTVVSGSLPPGLMLMSGTPAATLSGTPTQEGTYTFELQVQDSLSTTTTERFSVAIGQQLLPVTITATNAVGGVLPLPNAEGGQPYTGVIRAENGDPLPPNPAPSEVRYNWIVSDGQLPPGLSLATSGQGPDDAGIISGVPTALGTFTATVTVFDRKNATDSQIIRITVDPPAIPLTIDTVTLPDVAATGCSAFPVMASGGGNNGFQWAISAGSLPPGLSILPTGTPGTVISGAPSVASGTFSFTVQVTDIFDLVDTQDYTITIDAAKEGSPRWAVMVADADVDNQSDIYVTDMCEQPLQAPIRLNQVPPGGFHDVSTTSQRMAISPSRDALVFIADIDVDERFDVYFVDLRGVPTSGSAVSIYTGATTTLEADEVKWSPDGSKVAILTDHTDSFDYELWVADVSNRAAPGQAVRVSPVGAPSRGVYNDDYAFSPDSTKIAWVGDHDTAFSDYIYFSDLSGPAPSAPTLIHETPSSTGMDVNGGFVWTPDSRGIVFNADFNTVSTDEIWFSDLSGGAPYTASTISGSIVSSGDMDGQFTLVLEEHLSFSPDGSKLFMIGDRVSDGEDDLFLLDYASGAFTNLRPVTASSVSGAGVDSGKWSPDGRYIAARADLVVNNQDELYIFDTQGALPVTAPVPVRAGASGREMVGFRFFEDYRWSPDGTKVAFIGDFDLGGSDEVYVAEVGGGPPFVSHKVNPPTTDGAQDASEFRFSPDSQRMAVLGDFRTSFDELYVADISTLPPMAAFTAHRPFETTSFDVLANTVNGEDNSWFWLTDRRLVVRGDLVTSSFDAVYVLNVTNGTDTQPTLLGGPGQFLSASQDASKLILR